MRLARCAVRNQVVKVGSGESELTFQFSKTTQSLALDSSRIVLISLALAGLALVAWLLWFGFGNVTVYEVSRQARLAGGQRAARDLVAAGRPADPKRGSSSGRGSAPATC